MGMLDQLLSQYSTGGSPFGALAPSQGFENGSAPVIDPRTGLPIPAIQSQPGAPEAPFAPSPAVPLSGMLSDLAKPEQGAPSGPASTFTAPLPRPRPDGAPSGDDLASRFGALAQPDIPMPQPRPASAPGAPSPDGFDARFAAQSAQPSSFARDAASVPFGLSPQAALPSNAAPTSGSTQNLPLNISPSLPANPPAAAPAPAQQSPGILDRLSAATHNFRPAQQGIIPGLIDVVSGAITGKRTDPAGLSLQAHNQTERALLSRGVPAEIAAAAALNPTILQQVIGALGPKQYKFETMPDGAIVKIDPTGKEAPVSVYQSTQPSFKQISEDTFGAKKFGFVDPTTKKVTDILGNPITAENGGSTIPTGPDGQPISGKELLMHLEKNEPLAADGVKGLLAGNLNAGARNLQKLGPLAERVDPTFSAATFPARVALQKSYLGGGKDFQEVQSLNTVAGHMSRLADAADKLGNTGLKPWNFIRNAAQDYTTGSPALVKFRNDLVTTQNELAKAYHGGHVSDSAFAAFNKAIGESQTPDELKAAIGEISGLLKSKIEAKESAYRQGMGPTPLPSEFRAVNDEARHAYDKILAWSSGAPQSAPAAASAPAVPAPAPSRADVEAEMKRRGLMQ